MHRIITVVVVACAALSIAAARPAIAESTIIFVNAAADGMNDGSSWENAFADLQDALASAQSGDQIWITAGTYTPGPPGSPLDTTSFHLVSGVAISGGFAGWETELDQRDRKTNETILSGDLAGDGLQRVSHVLRGEGLAEGSTLDGLIIRDGEASIFEFDLDQIKGGGLWLSNSTLHIVNCTFTDNIALQAGGALFTLDSVLSLTNCDFIGNYAVTHGGAIRSESSEVVAEQCNFIENVAGERGAIDATGSTLVLNSCTFKENEVTGDASAVHAGGNVHIKNCLFKDNVGDGWALVTGAAIVENSSFINNFGGAANTSIVIGCEIIGNHAPFGGPPLSAAIVSNSLVTGNSSATGPGGVWAGTISESVIANNSATTEGGGVRVSGNAVISDSIIEGNSAIFGGGLVAQNTNLTIIRSTIRGNWAGIGGGGLQASSNSNLTVIDSIIRENFAGDEGGGVLVGHETGEPAQATIINSIISGNFGSGVHVGSLGNPSAA